MSAGSVAGLRGLDQPAGGEAAENRADDQARVLRS